MNERMKWKLKRVQAGVKIKDIADTLGIHNSTLSLYESGARNIAPAAERRYKAIITDALEGM